MPTHSAALARAIRFFESLTPATLVTLPEVYAGDARFKDPFNEVQGLKAIEHIYSHMFVQVIDPTFVVTEAFERGDQAIVLWDFVFRFRSGPKAEQRIRGATHLRFDAGGRIALHRDYWDAAEELYEKLPVLGALMRWLRRRARS